MAVCAVSTVFMLPDRHAQRGMFTATAAHLRPGGQLFIEAFRPDPSRFDQEGRRMETRPTIDGASHVVRSRHDPSVQRIHITHELSDDENGPTGYEVTLHYATTDQLDEMATAAGLRLIACWHDWTGTPVTAASTDPISVYIR